MNLFYAPDIAQTGELPADEAAHGVRVLRLQTGDSIQLTDGKGHFYTAVLTAATPKRCTVRLEEETTAQPRPFRLHLALAPTKNMDRVEWLVEKATEIGIDEISFLQTRCSERKQIKTERIEKIVVSAMKQSLKAYLPQVHEMRDLSAFLKQPFAGQKFIAHCHAGEKVLLKHAVNPGSDVLVLIGPEGDFTPDEVAQAVACGFVPISLGDARLRTETAALVACHTVALVNQ